MLKPPPRRGDEPIRQAHPRPGVVPTDPRPRLGLRQARVALAVLEEIPPRCRVQATRAGVDNGVSASAFETWYFTSALASRDRRISSPAGGPGWRCRLA